MNAHARQIIFEWARNSNLIELWNAILAEFPGNPKVALYLHQNFRSLVDGFGNYMRHTLLESHPMPGVSIAQQVAAFNREFLVQYNQFIHNHVIGNEEVPIFQVTDGLPTSRFGADHFRKKADDILATWNSVVSHGVQARDDKAANAGRLQGGPQCANTDRTRVSRPGPNCGTRSASGPYNPYNGSGDAHIVSGVVFADQSDLNTSSHVAALLDDPAIRALNKDAPAWTTTAFGNATPASDARLLSRRVFRSNEQGVENGVRMGEVRLQRRNLDRDIDETLHGDGEMSGLQREHDMTPLYCRVQNKQARREFYRPNQPPREFVFSTN